MQAVSSSVFSFLVLCLCAFAADAATYLVTDTSDAGPGSFYQAVLDANANPGDDTININISPNNPDCNSSGVCVIRLTFGELALTNASTTTVNNLRAPGTLIIQANGSARHFFIDGAARLVLNNITLANGGGRGSYQPLLNGRGGSIHLSSGDLELNDSAVTDNFTPLDVGAANIGGGGIYVGDNGRAVIQRATVSRNKSAAGAGIYNDGILTVVNSSVSSNEGVTNPANNINSSTGGGILSDGSQTQTHIANSTVSNNTSTLVGGVEPRNFAPIVLTNVTIAFNTANGAANGTGGITSNLVGTALIKMRNTIVSDNSAPGTNGHPNIFGRYQSGGRNLIGAADTAVVIGFNATDTLNSSNIFLGALALNGGPTETRVPAANSAAVNAGDNCVRTQLCADFNAPIALFTDQRGVSRQNYGQTDIGAVERQFVTIANNSTLANGRQGVAYAETLFASGGTGPYTFTLTDGALPAGVTLRADGFISGTPTQSGTFNFTVQVADSSPGSGLAEGGGLVELIAPQAVVAAKAFQITVFPPTAAMLSAGGRVLTADGRGISGAFVTVTETNGQTRVAMTNPFGYYRFENIPAGATCVFSVRSKRYTFAESSLVRSVNEDAGDINFVADK